MKLGIYNEEKEKESKVLRLTLENINGILLKAVDEKGKYISNICSITPNGKLRLCHSISKSLGLDLNEDGRINLENLEFKMLD